MGFFSPLRVAGEASERRWFSSALRKNQPGVASNPADLRSTGGVGSGGSGAAMMAVACANKAAKMG